MLSYISRKGILWWDGGFCFKHTSLMGLKAKMFKGERDFSHLPKFSPFGFSFQMKAY